MIVFVLYLYSPRYNGAEVTENPLHAVCDLDRICGAGMICDGGKCHQDKDQACATNEDCAGDLICGSDWVCVENWEPSIDVILSEMESRSKKENGKRIRWDD